MTTTSKRPQPPTPRTIPARPASPSPSTITSPSFPSVTREVLLKLHFTHLKAFPVQLKLETGETMIVTGYTGCRTSEFMNDVHQKIKVVFLLFMYLMKGIFGCKCSIRFSCTC